MQFLALAFAFVGVSLARPDVSHLNGYNYNQPSNGLGVGSSNVPTGSYLPGQSGNYQLDPRHGFGGGISGGFTNGNGFGISGNGNGFISGGGSYNPDAEQIQHQKSVYFFSAPDEEEQPRLRINVAPAAGQRNTKIIFIKAPSSSPPIPEVIAPPSQSEDKTLVYVLVKKPEQLGPITIPASATVKQAKPEVYFIKYRNKEEAEHAVSGGLNEQAVGSGVQSLADEQSFLRTLKDSAPVNGFGEGSSLLGTSAGLLNGGNGGGSSISVNTGVGLSSSNGGASISTSFGSKYGPPGGSGPY